jgi:hypothetical protein
MHAGDTIVQVAGRPIENIYDYTYALHALKVGQVVQIRVLREGDALAYQAEGEAKGEMGVVHDDRQRREHRHTQQEAADAALTCRSALGRRDLASRRATVRVRWSETHSGVSNRAGVMTA